MTALNEGDQADLFVTNVLNGTVAANGKVVNQGTVLRIELDVPNQGKGMPGRESTRVIGSGACGWRRGTASTALMSGATTIKASSRPREKYAD
jgi:hypothetical protein